MRKLCTVPYRIQFHGAGVFDAYFFVEVLLTLRFLHIFQLKRTDRDILDPCKLKILRIPFIPSRMYSSYAVAAAVCSVVFPVTATIAVGLRLRARRLNFLSLGSDDYLVIAALVSRFKH